MFSHCNGRSTPWKRVSRSDPCPICGKPDWCVVAEDAVICARIESLKRCGEAGWLHWPHEVRQERLRERRLNFPTLANGAIDFAEMAALKAEYRHHDVRGANAINAAVASISFGF